LEDFQKAYSQFFEYGYIFDIAGAPDAGAEYA
jgi:hypothetical protein